MKSSNVGLKLYWFLDAAVMLVVVNLSELESELKTQASASSMATVKKTWTPSPFSFSFILPSINKGKIGLIFFKVFKTAVFSPLNFIVTFWFVVKVQFLQWLYPCIRKITML